MKKGLYVSKSVLLLMVMLTIELCLSFLSGDLFCISQKIMLSIICLLCILWGLAEKFVLNPYFCFVLTPFSLLIYDKSVSTRFLTELSPMVYTVAVCSFIAFLCGLKMMRPEINEDFISDDYEPLNKSEKDNEFFRIGILLTAIWIIYQIARNVLGIPVPFSAIFVQLIYLACAFLLKSHKQLAYAFVIVISGYLLMSNFRKTAFLYLFILVMLAVFNNKNSSKRSMYLGILVTGLGGLFMIFLAYPLKMYAGAHGTLSGLSLNFNSLLNIMEENSVNYGEIGESVFILRPYLSMTVGWTNFDYVLQTQPAHTYGLFFIRPILNLLQFNTDSMSVFNLYPRSNYYNVFGFLTIQVKDFGYIGAAILTFFEGLLTTYCYKRLREHSDNVMEIIRYMFISCSVLEMFFSNHFLAGGVHIAYLLTWLIEYIIRHTNNRAYLAMKYE